MQESSGKLIVRFRVTEELYNRSVKCDVRTCIIATPITEALGNNIFATVSRLMILASQFLDQYTVVSKYRGVITYQLDNLISDFDLMEKDAFLLNYLNQEFEVELVPVTY